MSCCGAAGAAADDDDDAAADGAGFAVAVGGAAWGVLVLTLVLFSVGAVDGATDVSPPNNCPRSGAADLLRPLLGAGVGSVITGIVGSGSFLAFPLLLDFGFGDDAARSPAGAIGVSGARAAPLYLALYFDFAAADDAAADDAAA